MGCVWPKIRERKGRTVLDVLGLSAGGCWKHVSYGHVSGRTGKLCINLGHCSCLCRNTPMRVPRYTIVTDRDIICSIPTTSDTLYRKSRPPSSRQGLNIYPRSESRPCLITLKRKGVSCQLKTRPPSSVYFTSFPWRPRGPALLFVFTRTQLPSPPGSRPTRPSQAATRRRAP